MALDSEVMTLADIAQYLQLAEKTVLRMAQRGEIPAAKVASQWRFLKPVVKDWLATQMVSMPRVAAAPTIQETGPSLCQVMHPDLMSLNMTPGSKEKILRQLIAPLQKTGFLSSPDALLQSLIERENLMSTGVGHGIAIPHPRKPLKNLFSEPAIALGICPEGTPFGAIDDQPVHLFFLICAPSDGIHLELMAKIAWLGRQQQAINNLIQCRSQAEVIARLTEAMNLLES